MLPEEAYTQISPQDEPLLVDLTSEHNNAVARRSFRAKNTGPSPAFFLLFLPQICQHHADLGQPLVPGAANVGSDSSSRGHISDASPKLLTASTDPHQGGPGSSTLSQLCSNWCTELLGCPQEGS